MWRCSIFECLHQEAKLVLSLLLGEAKKLKHLVLEFRVVDTQAAASKLHAIDYHVVGIGTHIACVAVEHRDILVLRFGEGVVHCIETLRLLVPLKHREVDYPQRSKCVLVAQAKAVTHFKAKLIECLARRHRFAGKNEHQVARLRTETLSPSLEVVLAIEFAHTALHRAIGFELNPHKTLGSDLRTLHKLCQLINLLASVARTTLGTDSAHIFCTVEYHKILAFGEVFKLHKLHAEANIGLIATIIFHRISPRHARE